jgi:hypothetical protein
MSFTIIITISIITFIIISIITTHTITLRQS